MVAALMTPEPAQRVAFAQPATSRRAWAALSPNMVSVRPWGCSAAMTRGPLRRWARVVRWPRGGSCDAAVRVVWAVGLVVAQPVRRAVARVMMAMRIFVREYGCGWAWGPGRR